MGHDIRRVLTIAGSDCSGGAGIQADLKTMLVHGVYGMSVITALTAQNTTGIRAVQPVDATLVAQQIDAVFEDIRPDAVKVGMLPSAEVVACVAERLRHHGARKVVVDPVMVASTGSRLAGADVAVALVGELLPVATVVTPNLDEALCLAKLCAGPRTGEGKTGAPDSEEAARSIAAHCGCAVLLKGGHRTGDATDLLFEGNELTMYPCERIDNRNTHGTGCTLSSALAAHLARGHDLRTSVALAKRYLTGALQAQLDLGAGSGPLDHGYALRAER